MGHGGDEELIHQDLRGQDVREEQATQDAREIFAALLKDKGFTPDNITETPAFNITSRDGKEEEICADYLLGIDGKPIMVVKCAMSLVSRERHVLALARSVGDTPIPLCAVTDGLSVHVIRTDTGEVLSTRPEELPTREDMALMADKCSTGPLDKDRRAREIMVLQAYEVTACPRVEDKKE